MSDHLSFCIATLWPSISVKVFLANQLVLKCIRSYHLLTLTDIDLLSVPSNSSAPDKAETFFDSCWPAETDISKSFNRKFLLLGDTLRSIHPVAGQGWNLGVKDIQHLGYCLDQYNIENKEFNNIYFSNRHVEAISFLGFTSLINYLYENQNALSDILIKLGFYSLNKFSQLKKSFIQKAMGRL